MEVAGVVERVEHISAVRANPAADAVLIKSDEPTVSLMLRRQRRPRSRPAVWTWKRRSSKRVTAWTVWNGSVVTPGRRALHGLYRGCSIPGCTVGYDRCKLHHIIWWINGGTTDLNNVIPVCSFHHTKIRNDGWIIELGPHREPTLRLPDGSIRTTGPPTRRTAA